MVRSGDGTRIHYTRQGTGPAVVCIDAAGCYRGFGPLDDLAERLSRDLTVITYDRRGRGESADTSPYAVEREVEDVAALRDRVGGSAYLYGFSSGGLLALHAARALSIERIALLEPPIRTDEDLSEEVAFTAQLAGLVAAGRREDAVRLFQSDLPEEFAATGPALATLATIAHTLVYDCEVSVATSLSFAAQVASSTLIIDSQGSTDDLAGWAAALTAAMPNATRLSLPGAWHGVPPEDLAPVVVDFFAG